MSDLQSTVEYRLIPGFPGYRVGSDGTVWSRMIGRSRGFGSKWRQLRLHRKRYLTVELHPGAVSKAVHRLVLELFVGPCPEGMQTCHNDGNYRNNAVTNLRWGSAKDNADDRKRHGRNPDGEKSPHAKLTAEVVSIMRKEYFAGLTTTTKLAKEYGVRQCTIWNAVNKKTWKHV